MAEALAALGAIASIGQLADYGFKLSLKLYSFSAAVSSADASITTISNDISLTSTVLKELAQILEIDKSEVVSKNAMEAMRQTVTECLAVFAQLDEALDKSLVNLGLTGLGNEKKPKRGTITLERLKWPFKQSKMELLSSNLDRLKASLTLMLQVLTYARSVSSLRGLESTMAYQQRLIESMAITERAMKKRYNDLQKTIESESLEKRLNVEGGDFSINSSRDTADDGVDSQVQSLDTGPSAISKRKTFIGELLLSFKLLNGVLQQPIVNSDIDHLSSILYGEFRSAVERIQEARIHSLEAIYIKCAKEVKVQAVTNIRDRLEQLITDGEELDGTKIKIMESQTTTYTHQESLSYGSTYQSFSSAEVERYEVDLPPKYDILEYGELDSTRIGPVSKHTSDSARPPTTHYTPHSSSGTVSSPSVGPSLPRPAPQEAQVDLTINDLKDLFDKVSQRGERLNSLQDQSDNLAVSAAGFYRGANRASTSPLNAAYEGIRNTVVEIGNFGQQAVKAIGERVYESSTGLFNGKIIDGDEDEDLDGDGENEDVLAKLLSEWTNLPPQLRRDVCP